MSEEEGKDHGEDYRQDVQGGRDDRRARRQPIINKVIADAWKQFESGIVLLVEIVPGGWYDSHGWWLSFY